MSNNDNDIDSLNNELIHNCPLLCSGPERHIIPAWGWRYPLTDMAYRLEKLNFEYAKYGFRVVFDQTKEKFGEFRGYWRIDVRPAGFNGFIYGILETAYNELENEDYGRKYVVDEPAVEYIRFDEQDYDTVYDKDGNIRFGFVEISKPESVLEKYDIKSVFEGKDGPINCPQFKRMAYTEKTKDGKTRYMVSICVNIPAKRHMEITKNKLKFKFMNALYAGMNKLTQHELDRYRNVMYNAFEIEVRNIIDYAARECNDRCIRCGTNIGEHGLYSKCETHGWITYICKRCAENQNGMYYDTELKKWFKDGQECENPYKKRKNKQD